MDTLVLLPSFIEVLDEAKSLSSSPANLVIIFFVLGKKLGWFVVYVSIKLNLPFDFPVLLCVFTLIQFLT